jgi:hypothetical protein
MAREANRKTIHCTLRLPDDGLEDQINASMGGRSTASWFVSCEALF